MYTRYDNRFVAVVNYVLIKMLMNHPQLCHTSYYTVIRNLSFVWILQYANASMSCAVNLLL